MTQSLPTTGDHDVDQAHHSLFGLSAALVTPFNEDLMIDHGRLVDLASSVLASGCSSVTLFGTSGEGASLTDQERSAVHHALVDSGIDAAQIVVGITATAAGTAIEQARTALGIGCSALLVTPPFYYKNISEAGLYDWYSGLIESIVEHAPRVILYHIPQVTGVSVSVDLLLRLKGRFGDIVFGVKDSGGYWPTTQSFLAQPGIAVIVGDERFLAPAIRAGAAGMISGVANIFPAAITKILASGNENNHINTFVDALVQIPVHPALKLLIGHRRGEKGWQRVRPPLVEAAAAKQKILISLMGDADHEKVA